MEGKFLIINAGSSSLKFSLYEMPEEKEILNGCVEKIGNHDSFYTLKFNNQKLEKNRLIIPNIIFNDFIKLIWRGSG